MKEHRIKVLEKKGKCDNMHEVGDEFVLKGPKTPEGICLGAFTAIMPSLMALIYGANIPFGQEKNVMTVACPDPKNCVIWEIRRIDS